LEGDVLDHVTIGVRDLERSKIFYDTILRSIGIERLYAEGERFAGYGIGKKAFFWIGQRDAPQTSAHIALQPAASTTALPGFVLTIMRTTMALSFSIRMATTSKRFVTCR
jgi:catechol 2,3-dioxygenase-like lactoylglutathione lyase family enzyme